jgi:hypothetical protein
MTARERLNKILSQIGALSFTGATFEDARKYIELCSAAPEFDTPDNVLNAYERMAKELLRKLYAIQNGPERDDVAAIRNWLIAVIGDSAYGMTDTQAMTRYQELRDFYGEQILSKWQPAMPEGALAK